MQGNKRKESLKKFEEEQFKKINDDLKKEEIDIMAEWNANFGKEKEKEKSSKNKPNNEKKMPPPIYQKKRIENFQMKKK